jgi:TonB family protein
MMPAWFRAAGAGRQCTPAAPWKRRRPGRRSSSLGNPMHTRVFYVALGLGLLPLALLLSASCVSTGGASTGSAVVRPELERPPADRDYYPAQAKRLGLTGRVGLEYSVDTRGHAQNIVVTESAGHLLDDNAKVYLSDARFTIPPDWSSTGGPEKRQRMGIIFNLTNKPKVPWFEDDRMTVVVTFNPGP